jgi:hypothetical protein
VREYGPSSGALALTIFSPRRVLSAVVLGKVRQLCNVYTALFFISYISIIEIIETSFSFHFYV